MTQPHTASQPHVSTPTTGTEAGALSRRRFLTFLAAAPTLAVGVRYGLLDGVAQAVIPGTPEPADTVDLGDILIWGAKPTESMLIQLTLDDTGIVHCALPREEAGQGINTAVTMLIADELDLPMNMVSVTLADARPELLTGQLTGGSNTIRSVYEPVRMAAASMRGSLVAAAAQRFGSPKRGLLTRDGVVTSPTATPPPMPRWPRSPPTRSCSTARPRPRPPPHAAWWAPRRTASTRWRWSPGR